MKARRIRINEPTYNTKDVAKIVDMDGNIIETFRTKMAAKFMLGYYRERFGNDLEVQPI